MTAICPNCAALNREGARYCDSCGTNLRADSAERPHDRTIELRQGTVLFCDLVQSTRLANSLDVDDLRGVFKGFREIVADVVRRYSGHLIQFNGDGAFVLFGYPRAREDAAESALDCALALVQSVRESRPVGGAVLDLRVGVASGTVVTGEIEREAATHQESVIGSVVHLAARLVAKAQPGRVVIDDATKRLTGRFFEYRDLGRLHLKGFDEGVQAWLVLRASSIASRFEAKHADRSALAIVGRSEPLARLRAGWARAAQGESTTVILDGEAGIGKSLLAREVRREALNQGACILDIDCSPRTANTPLSPVSTLLRRLIGKAPKDPAAAEVHARAWLQSVLGNDEGASVFPFVAPLLGVATPPADAAESPDRLRLRMIGVLVDLVRALALRQPLFVLCEDAHWADATTMELVTKVSAEVIGVPMLVVVTTRSTDGDGRQIEIPNAVSISLAPLDVAESAALVRLATPEGNLPTAIVEQIVTRCEGNPLYLEEATRGVLEAAVQRGSERVHAPALRDVPTSLQGLVQARLDRWPSVKSIVQAASVVGRDFTLPLLELLLPERVDVPQAIALLVDRELLVRDGEKPSGSMRFKHALIHDAVYQTIVRSERLRLHSRTADALALHFAGQPESAPDLLAHHLAAAHRDQEATFAFAEASDLAAARAAHVESIGHSRAALALAEHITDDRMRRQLQRRVLIRLGVALAAINGYASPEVLETYHHARDLCATEDDPAELFPIVRGLGTFYFVRGDILEADALSEQCLALARRSGRMDLLIEALSFRGYPAHYRGDLCESRRTLEECLDVYRAEHGERFVYPSAQDAATAAWSLLITTRWLQGDTAGADMATTELLAHVDRLQRPFDEAYARVWIAGQCHLERRLDEALHHANIGFQISQKHGFNTWLATSLMMASMATALRTASPESIELLRGTHRAFMQAGANLSAPFYLWGLARALAVSGDREQARDVLSEAARRARLNGESYLNAELLATEAELESDGVRALECLREALRIAEEQGAVTLALRAAAMLVQRHGDIQHPDTAVTRAALRALDGDGPYPSEQEWVSDALQTVKRVLLVASAAGL